MANPLGLLGKGKSVIGGFTRLVKNLPHYTMGKPLNYSNQAGFIGPKAATTMQSRRANMAGISPYNPFIVGKTGKIGKTRLAGAGLLGLIGSMALNKGGTDTSGMTPAQLADFNRMNDLAAEAQLKSQFYPTQESYSTLGTYLNQLSGGIKPYAGVGGGTGQESYGNVIDAYKNIYGGGDVSTGSAMLPESGAIIAGNQFANTAGQSQQELANAQANLGGGGGGYAKAVSKETQNMINMALLQRQLSDKAQGDADWRSFLLDRAKTQGVNTNPQLTGTEPGLADAYTSWISLSPVQRQQYSVLGINSPYDYYNYLAAQNPTKYGG